MNCPVKDETYLCETPCMIDKCPYQQGRADEQIQSIEDAKKQAAEYLNALNKAKEEAYQQCKADTLDEVIKTLAKSEDTMLSDAQYYTLMELKGQNK